jgi:uncharacterized radical SAM superfamily Fe-S cluster-containing enzyme
MCFAESGPGGQHVDFETYKDMVDRVVRLEGVADIVQLSGGEPTLHPDLVRMVRYAYEQPILAVMLNTNGIRLSHDPALVEQLAAMRDRVEVYLQFDGFDERTHLALRGEELMRTKLLALDNLARHDLRCSLVCTVDHNTNLHEVGRVLRFGLERAIVRGISYQLATYCGRHLDPRDLDRRVTMPDLVKALVAQTDGLVAETDFYPLPCAHPNCHMMCYLYRGGERVTPVNRLIDVTKHMDLIANSVIFTPARARQIVTRVLESTGGCGCGPGGCPPREGEAPAEPGAPGREGEAPAEPGAPRLGRSLALPPGKMAPGTDEFIVKALAEQLNGEQVFRVTLTGFLDAHTFDTRRVMKCCLAHVLPSGHVVPFCAYNTLYRDGFVPLPPLADAARRSLSLVSS